MRFWDTEDGKILSYAMHEHGNASCIIGTNVQLILAYLKNGKLTDEKLKESLESIQKAQKRANDSVDYIYNKFKNKHENKRQEI